MVCFQEVDDGVWRVGLAPCYCGLLDERKGYRPVRIGFAVVGRRYSRLRAPCAARNN